MGSFSKLKKVLETGERFLLVAHREPDGDCLGGILALGRVLSLQGKSVRMVCYDLPPLVFSFLPGVENIKNDFLSGDFDAIVLIDNGDSKRTGFSDRLFRSSTTLINIDHHPRNDLWKRVNINYANESASSSCELIYNILQGLEFPLDAKIATCLLTGIFTDTGGFQHSNTSDKILDIVADLLSHGARLNLISENIINSRNVSTLKLWGLALKKLKVNKKYSLVYSFLSRKEIDDLGAKDEDISGLINIFNSSVEARISLLLCETLDGKVRGSLRTGNDKINVAFLAKLLGGGGHRKASGFTFSGKIEDGIPGLKIV